MIKVTMLVKRHEDRYETEYTFDSSESKPQAADALAEFFRKKVYEQSGLASRYREQVVERSGVIAYTVKMDFKSRKDIANALRTIGGGKINRYYEAFESQSKNYVEEVLQRPERTLEEDIRLIEPQKFVLFRSTKMRGIIFTILLLSDNVVELVFPSLDMGAWNLVFAVGVLALFYAVDFVFGQPGGIRMMEKRRPNED